MSAHLYRPVQDASGDLVNAMIALLEPGTETPISERIYADRNLTETLDQPFSVAGVLECYLERPRVVRVKATTQMGVYYFEDQAVGFPHWETFSFTLVGEVAVSVGTMRFYVEENCHIESVRASLGMPSAGQPVIVDVNANGSSVFTDQSHRPAIGPGANTVVVVPDETYLPAGTYLTLDVDQVGLSYPGAQLVIQIRVGRA